MSSIMERYYLRYFENNFRLYISFCRLNIQFLKEADSPSLSVCFGTRCNITCIIMVEVTEA
jgi:hypothetical protein